jgi:hypothetical protein
MDIAIKYKNYIFIFYFLKMNGLEILNKIIERNPISTEYQSELLVTLNENLNIGYFDNIQSVIKKFDSDNDYLRMMKYVFSEIIMNMMNHNIYYDNVNHIFFVYTYIEKELTYNYIKYVYNYISGENQLIINDRLLIFIYMNMIKYSVDYEDVDILDEEYEKIYVDNLDIIKKLYKDGYIKNPLYSTFDEIENDNYEKISLFDFYVHSTFVMELSNVGNLILKIIMNNDYGESELNGLFGNFVNLDSIFMLDQHSKNIGRMCVETMCDKFDTIYFYQYKMFYYMIKDYLELKNKNKNLSNLNYMLYFVNIMISKNIHMVTFVDTYDFDDLIPLLAHQIIISNDDLKSDQSAQRAKIDNMIGYVVKRLNESNISDITHMYVCTMWLRLIYLPHRKIVRYDPTNDYYYIENNDKKQKNISFDEYINDIIQYLSRCNYQVREYLILQMNKYVNEIYVEMKSIESKKLDDNISCSICMDEIEVGCVTQCMGCKNYFHKTCQKDLFASKHKFCPLCRKCVYSTMVLNVDTRYKLFREVLVLLEK